MLKLICPFNAFKEGEIEEKLFPYRFSMEEEPIVREFVKTNKTDIFERRYIYCAIVFIENELRPAINKIEVYKYSNGTYTYIKEISEEELHDNPVIVEFI